MAVTGKQYYKLPEDQYPQSGYQGLAGVSDNTAQQAQKAQQDYQPNQQAQQAQNQLQNIQAQKPQTYNSKYAPALDNILKQIQNPQQFKYSFDGDELFKYYADLYTQKGKQAAQDTMGQAAALTGGYGNSYGQLAANQAYDQYLLNLYDKGLDMRDRAYQQFRDEQGDILNQYNVLADRENTDYGRYRDDVGDWNTELNYWTDRADTEADRGWNQYLQNRDYWTQMAGAENQDWWNAQNQDLAERQFAESTRQFDEQLAENIRQFNESLDFDKMNKEQERAAQYALAILQNGEMPTMELLQAAGLSQEDAQKLMAQLKTGGGGGKRTSEYGDYFYTDKNGNYYVYDENGNAIQVPKSKVPNDATIDTSIGNFQGNVENLAGNVANALADAWNNSSFIQGATNSVNNLMGGIGNTVSSLLGKGSTVYNPKPSQQEARKKREEEKKEKDKLKK